MTRLIAFNKPFNVLSQFTDKSTLASSRETLSDYMDVPRVYPAGRLDRDSEGLLLLTDDGKLQARISDPKAKMAKVYWAQIEGIPDDKALQALRSGVDLNDGRTAPAKVRRMDEPEDLWPRDPPIRFRKSVPDCWIELTIIEGRNRQVRRMTAAVGHPTLRLVRAQIGDWTLNGLAPGEWRDIKG
ncbi:pseudouridine synthase [Hyphomonas sp.]|jgi:23S rRNA pseudouridine2457 synthase|uniref:pseudouridine synthase n=1 Tax=Hyphomonas sp. TaxID=87 RepID=UPI000E0454C8|nr:pseudouridine synthase [Hyphomonas sp.]RCL85526.1 MAG: pseudouridine synthase [Hyphomonas sp.]